MTGSERTDEAESEASPFPSTNGTGGSPAESQPAGGTTRMKRAMSWLNTALFTPPDEVAPPEHRAEPADGDKPKGRWGRTPRSPEAPEPAAKTAPAHVPAQPKARWGRRSRSPDAPAAKTARAEVSGAEVSGAEVSGAEVSGARVRRGRVSGARVSGRSSDATVPRRSSDATVPSTEAPAPAGRKVRAEAAPQLAAADSGRVALDEEARGPASPRRRRPEGDPVSRWQGGPVPVGAGRAGAPAMQSTVALPRRGEGRRRPPDEIPVADPAGRQLDRRERRTPDWMARRIVESKAPGASYELGKMRRFRRRKVKILRSRANRRLIRRIDTWTVFKVSFVFYVLMVAIVLVAGTVAWSVAQHLGFVSDIQKSVRSLADDRTFIFRGSAAFKYSAEGGAVLGVLGTLFNTVAAMLYNLLSDVIGGFQVIVVTEPD